MSNFDEKAKADIKTRTDKDTEGLKNEIWNALEQELFTENQTPRGEVKKMKRKNRVMPILVTVAAGVLIVFSLQTDTGTAFMKNIKEMFVPEKEVTQNIEGHDEKTNVQLNEGKDSEYVIYVDETRYKMMKGDDSDLITTKEPLPEQYPDVTMQIKQVSDVIPEVLVKEYEAELKKEFPELKAIEEVTEPVEGFLLHGINGNEANSVVVHAYVVSNGKEGSFVITEHYFLEAAEGHGARFHRMLESFEIVE